MPAKYNVGREKKANDTENIDKKTIRKCYKH